jgi:hypothetical protein
MPWSPVPCEGVDSVGSSPPHPDIASTSTIPVATAFVAPPMSPRPTLLRSNRICQPPVSRSAAAKCNRTEANGSECHGRWKKVVHRRLARRSLAGHRRVRTGGKRDRTSLTRKEYPCCSLAG